MVVAPYAPAGAHPVDVGGALVTIILFVVLLFTVWTTPSNWSVSPSWLYRCVPWVAWAAAIVAECFLIAVLEQGWPW